MILEDEIFNKYKACNNKLIDYGFILKDWLYQYEINIFTNFKLIILIKDNSVKALVYDLDFNSLYNNYRIINNNGSFANAIKDEDKNILLDIRNKCFIEEYFKYLQSNRISKLIENEYNIKPKFIMKKFPNYGIFKNDNNKWFAIIMNINRNKLDNLFEDIEIINIKIKEIELNNLLKIKGIYKAYHMNKNNWISIILNDNLSDDFIFKLVKESYNIV